MGMHRWVNVWIVILGNNMLEIGGYMERWERGMDDYIPPTEAASANADLQKLSCGPARQGLLPRRIRSGNLEDAKNSTSLNVYRPLKQWPPTSKFNVFEHKSCPGASEEAHVSFAHPRTQRKRTCSGPMLNCLGKRYHSWKSRINTTRNKDATRGSWHRY